LINPNGHSDEQLNGFNDPYQTEESSYDKLRKYWWLIRRKLWLVLILALLGATYQYSEISKVKERYRSNASVILDGSSTDRAVALLGVPGARYGYDNELIILRSDQLAQKVAESLLNSFENSRKIDTLQILKNGGGGIDNIEQISQKVKNNVSFVTGNEEESIIYIHATAYDPEEAAIIANTYARTYELNNVRNSVKQVREAKKYIDTKIRQTNDSLLSSEMEILSFYRKHGYSESELSSESLLDRLTNLYTKMDDVRLQIVGNQEEIEAIDSTLKASRSNETTIILGATDNLINYYEEKVKEFSIRKEEEIAKLAKTDSEETNTIIKNINAKLTNYQNKLEVLLNKKLDNSSLLSTVDGSIAKYWIDLKARKTALVNETGSLKKQLNQLEKRIKINEQRLDTIPFLEMELDKKQRMRQNYFSLLQKFYNRKVEIELAEVSEGGYVSLLDPAKPNYSPINKQKMAGVVQGSFFGILFAILIIIGLDKIDDRIKSDEDVKELNINVISSIPSMDTFLNKEYEGKDFIDYRGAFISTKLVTVLNPLSGISEMYRRLRTNFLFSQPDKAHKSILISSSNPQEGKSLSAANLAVVLASSGKQVALVDADLRRPNLDILFGITKTPGLSNYVVEDLHMDDIIKQTVVDNLSLVPAGSQVPNPSELLGSQSFKDFYTNLNSEFEYVIIDSPPLNSVIDAVTISELIDQILIIINVGKTKKKEVRQTLELLKVVRGKLSGFLLNNLDQRSYISDYNYYQNYNYYGNRHAVSDFNMKGVGDRIDV